MKSAGQALFDEVVRKLKLVESDYFDLEYTDVHGAIVSTAGHISPFIAELEVSKYNIYIAP